ncbi:MAG: hypothetical protein MJH10_14065 [Epibacterium sp.]|nr:hypothetical protein [Epibacterium sp.]NQX74656.1 hypothetical protein [Epibacterium sp.]
MSVETLFIETYRGHKFYPGNPSASTFNVADIAHHLSQINRYHGSAKFPYSVAQHSALMAEKMYAMTNNAELALDCLFHDASEAYLNDVAKPLKMMLPKYQEIEERTDKAIRQWLYEHRVFIPLEQTQLCKDADKRMFLTEWPVLKNNDDAGAWYPNHKPFEGVTIEEWDWKRARQTFYSMAREFANEAAHSVA